MSAVQTEPSSGDLNVEMLVPTPEGGTPRAQKPVLLGTPPPVNEHLMVSMSPDPVPPPRVLSARNSGPSSQLSSPSGAPQAPVYNDAQNDADSRERDAATDAPSTLSTPSVSSGSAGGDKGPGFVIQTQTGEPVELKTPATPPKQQRPGGSSTAAEELEALFKLTVAGVQSGIRADIQAIAELARADPAALSMDMLHIAMR